MPHTLKTFTFVSYPNVIGSRKALLCLSSGGQMKGVSSTSLCWSSSSQPRITETLQKITHHLILCTLEQI